MILNKSPIDTLPTPPTGYAIHWVEKMAGFGLRVTSTGAKAFILQRRITGKDKRITLGRYGDLTAEQAKKEAKKLAGEIASGDDPIADKAKKKIESKPLQDAFNTYIERRTLKPQTVFDIRRCMKEVYPDWLDKPMTRITPDMVVKRHRDYGQEHSEARANLAMRYLRAILNFAAAVGDFVFADSQGRKISNFRYAQAALEKASGVKAHVRHSGRILGYPGLCTQTTVKPCQRGRRDSGLYRGERGALARTHAENH